MENIIKEIGTLLGLPSVSIPLLSVAAALLLWMFKDVKTRNNEKIKHESELIQKSLDYYIDLYGTLINAIRSGKEIDEEMKSLIILKMLNCKKAHDQSSDLNELMKHYIYNQKHDILLDLIRPLKVKVDKLSQAYTELIDNKYSYIQYISALFQSCVYVFYVISIVIGVFWGIQHPDMNNIILLVSGFCSLQILVILLTDELGSSSKIKFKYKAIIYCSAFSGLLLFYNTVLAILFQVIFFSAALVVALIDKKKRIKSIQTLSSSRFEIG
ncbi:hypothetical protein M5X06_22010 [Paenibacillus alvei]|uniref:Uncharacterized protein n=1 Tax=Paenibacillus alvei TaxID=44250 RepID=A0ABT4H2P2_PAEAL|nr:hypothetical protein [Paenibacillus alvei]MCY9763246.1 hypothetical protein [Paenibacillus alvei]MCY9769465.1 hypothetical protein [Paenibacillus alvei]